MAAAYEFCVIRLAPQNARGERLNVGLAVFTDDNLDVRLARRLEKVRAISAAVESDALGELLRNLSSLDEIIRSGGDTDSASRRRILDQVAPLSLSEFGTFSAAHSGEYEERVQAILKAMIEPEPAPAHVRMKRSRLLTQVKNVFRQERVLAKKDETLDSHRIVQQFELDEGLVADFVLRNGSMHVVETVDASGDENSLRRAIGEIGIAALVLERARMKFGDDRTNARLVYEASAAIERIAQPSLEAAAHQGAVLTNWASADERSKFVHSMSSLATPVRRKREPVAFVPGAKLL